jgi:DNA mismatch repair ATPase MutS
MAGQGTRSDLLHNALLNDEKLDKRLQQIEKICEEVPKATEWATHVLEKSLAPADLCEIIKTAVAPLTNLEDVGSLESCSDEMTYILTMALRAFSQADKLESKQAIAVAKLVGSALLRVSDGVEGHPRLRKYFKTGQIRSRNFASWLCWLMARLPGWKGREMQLYLMLGKNQTSHVG